MAFNGRGPADFCFSTLNAITMTYFIVEITLNSIAKPDYFFGFYWVPVTFCGLLGLCASAKAVDATGYYFCGGFYFWLDPSPRSR